MIYGCQTWSLTKALVKKLETSQRAMKGKMLNVKLKDRVRNTIIRQRTRVTDIVQTNQYEIEMGSTHGPNKR